MNITWVRSLPTGKETGTYLALDLGGTNLRVCVIHLKSNKSQHSITQSEYHIPADLKKGTADQLWTYIADNLSKFLEEKNLLKEYNAENPIPLGFTFSYPATQDKIDHGILQRWTKGFDISGVEGQDAAQQLRDAMAARNLPVQLVALVNDTVGAMIASAYYDPSTIIGGIFGTGCNAAYMEDCSSIPKLHPPSNSNKEESEQMAINCEYGAFDNRRQVLPITEFDQEIDAQSPKPGEQTFEKMSAGLYLGEIFRLVLVKLADRGLLFQDQDLGKLKQSYIIDT